jgi:ABC-type bacteriocin/lantibiotic exporter with double-glycine peptidase domain
MTLLPVSHQQQREEADCLVACTAMVLTYLQIPYHYEQLRRVLRTEQHGTIFSHLGHLETITHHAVVIIGIDGDRVYLNDPAFVTAPQIVARDEFEPAWIEHNYRFAVITLERL